MKKALVLCALLAVGLVFAGGAAEEGKMHHGKMEGMTHKMNVEVVSVDAAAKTITVKDEKGENHTAPVMGKAEEMFKTLKPGEKVVVVCQDNEKGAHQGVVKIEKAPAGEPASKPTKK